MRSKKLELRRELNFEHSIAFFGYHIMVGLLFVKIFESGIYSGVLFGITIFFHSTISSLSLHEIHYNIRESRIMRFILATSTLLGTLIGIFVSIPNQVYYALLSFITGTLFYIVVRDNLPEERRGKPISFLIGILLYIILFISLSSI
jgi:zinc transporter ZupT